MINCLKKVSMAGTLSVWYLKQLAFGRNETLLSSFVICLLLFVSLGVCADTVGVDDTSGKVILVNSRVRLTVASGEEGFYLEQLRGLDGHDFLGRQPGACELWRVSWRNSANEIVTLDSNVPSRRSHRIIRHKDGQRLLMRWADVKVGGDQRTWQIEASVSLPCDIGRSEWRISVRPKAGKVTLTDYGVWTVQYPIIHVSSPSASPLSLAVPHFTGKVISPATLGAETFYPSHRGTMQFNAIWNPQTERGLYIACEDGQARQKKIICETYGKTGLCFRIYHYPEGMGQPGQGYEQPYSVVLQPFKGTYANACKMYRQWALRQSWCAKGRIAERNDIPQSYKDCPFWFVNDQKTTADDAVSGKRQLGLPAMYQLYFWHHSKFDTNYPDYFPAKTSLHDTIGKCSKAGMRVVPYINGRLWDTASESWQQEKGWQAVTKAPARLLDDLAYHCWPENGRDLMNVMEHWAGRNHGVICPTSDLWKTKMLAICQKLADSGAGGIYLDQIGSYYPVLCFDPSHGHALGGGNYWSQGYRKMMATIRKEVRIKHPDTTFFTEDCAEPYLDSFDGFLTCNVASIAPFAIPMFQLVYSGYYLGYGRYVHYGEPGSILLANAQLFLWGQQMGFIFPEYLKSQGKIMAMIQAMCKARMAGLSFLRDGEMLPSLKNQRDTPLFKVKSRPGQQLSSIPMLDHSLWRDAEGNLGLVLVNVGEQPLVFEPDLKRLIVSENGWCLLHKTTGTTHGISGAAKRPMFTVAPHSVQIWTIRP